jgi:acetyl-CoA carboxylase biotin carboxyl carrier protein
MSETPINLEELKELIKLLRESNVSEFELRKADYRLRIRHGMIVDAPQEMMAALARSAQSAQEIPGNGQFLQTGEAPQLTPKEPEEVLHEVRSPMVCTFYRSSSPGSAPFVEVGSVIRQGQVLCIVEAMKIMNEIEADIEGEVRKIHVTNGQPVEYGEILYSIKTL